MRDSPLTRLFLALPGPLQAVARATMDVLKTHRHSSWSQEGEDRILSVLLRDHGPGFYVDVGAHHPKRFSNTFLLYRSGWRGLNIEPDPDLARAFHVHRKRDVTAQVGIGTTAGSHNLYRFSDAALNTFDAEIARAREGEGWSRRDTISVRVAPLKELLAEYGVDKVDVLNIDVEGRDLDLLRSNDWQHIRPKLILVEIVGTDVLASASDACHIFLANVGYRLAAKTPRTAIYQQTGSNDLGQQTLNCIGETS